MGSPLPANVEQYVASLAQDYRVVCGWCGRHLHGPQIAPSIYTSHGICPDCAALVLEASRRGGPRG